MSIVHQIHHQIGLVPNRLTSINIAFSILKRLQLGEWPLSRHLDLAKHVQVSVFEQELNEIEALQDAAVLEGWRLKLQHQVVDDLDTIWAVCCIGQLHEFLIRDGPLVIAGCFY